MSLRPAWSTKKYLVSKKRKERNNNKTQYTRLGVKYPVADHLPSTLKVLGSSPSTFK
jgi:hypothetical protein